MIEFFTVKLDYVTLVFYKYQKFTIGHLILNVDSTGGFAEEVAAKMATG